MEKRQRVNAHKYIRIQKQDRNRCNGLRRDSFEEITMRKE